MYIESLKYRGQVNERGRRKVSNKGPWLGRRSYTVKCFWSFGRSVVRWGSKLGCRIWDDGSSDGGGASGYVGGTRLG
jgi:hypothetical protein